MTIARSIGALICMMPLLSAQRHPPRPPQPGPPDTQQVTRHIADIREKLERTPAPNTTSQRALAYSRSYLHRAETLLKAHRLFPAERTVAAADSLLHIAEHQEHLRTDSGPKDPPPLPEIRRHLERVYFQLQQADYFLTESHDRQAAPFPKWAHDFYQVAVKASEAGDAVAADENAKCAEEVVRTLENLAQAATENAAADQPPPPPPPPPGAQL